MKYNFQKKMQSPRLSMTKNKTMDSDRRSLILQSMDSFLGIDEDELSLGDLPPVNKPSIRKPGALTRDDRSTSTEVTALDDSVASFDLTEMEKEATITILPVSPFPESHPEDIGEVQEDCFDSDDDEWSTKSLEILELRKLSHRRSVSIQSVEMDENCLRMPDLRKSSVPPMRRTSISVPVAPIQETKQPSRRSSVSFAEMAEVSFIDKLDAKNTDFDSLYWNEEELADFRHEAFLEECGIADEDFDD
ncbi:unnamed protein product [Cylindrotheca closterium]|uniref:Uncharacterized protein n=1 Tax=Cylindrotheca closterium TaxID=2856 RepID=A0AAD2FL19_9STRA|nr:unnamed protein product [Cylindrotheca closterium]